jgi:phosphoadenosine phosphosulfate reductase
MDISGSLSHRGLIPEWAAHLEPKAPGEVIQWCRDTFGKRVAFASSLGAEDQVITHFLAQVHAETRVFTLDTGRLFPETYELISATEARYNLTIEIFLPDSFEVESMVKEHGINLFYASVENRKLCCAVRKIHPLRRALAGSTDAWICGLRREQTVTRQQVRVVEWDDQNALVKINPLWNWAESTVWDFIKQNEIPYNRLHDEGFPSIGCSCCTRAVTPGEDVRAGRWWWEQPGQKECGLHLKGGRLVRAE